MGSGGGAGGVIHPFSFILLPRSESRCCALHRNPSIILSLVPRSVKILASGLVREGMMDKLAKLYVDYPSDIKVCEASVLESHPRLLSLP